MSSVTGSTVDEEGEEVIPEHEIKDEINDGEFYTHFFLFPSTTSENFSWLFFFIAEKRQQIFPYTQQAESCVVEFRDKKIYIYFYKFSIFFSLHFFLLLIVRRVTGIVCVHSS